MPKLSQPATARKVQPAAQDAMFISYTPQGAVPPSEKAGVEFEIEMVLDAIEYHENGDETDPACCTGDNPCDTRIFLVGRQRDLAKKALAARTSPTTPVVEDEAPRTPAGNGTGSARPVADPASPKQIAYIETLVRQHDTSAIGTFPARTLAQIQKGEEVSKGRASKLIEVLKRQPKQVEEIHNAATPAGPAASAAQLGFLRTLCSEQGEEVRTSYTKQEASDEITRLLKARDEAPKGQVRTTGGVTEDGMYQTPDGTVYKVQIAKQGSGRLYAKKLTEHEDGWSFEYAAGAMRNLTADMKMSLADAQEFGKLYGVCCRCAADLTDEDSIARGMGPICAGKM
ncbi:hypothetical protein SEA_KEANU_36 [Streptomyces phage Keanu]|nr:hypothetical protein SEA_KEANU_36 [Streptomyces phage Keanu]